MIVNLSKSEVKKALQNYIRQKLINSSTYNIEVMNSDGIPEKGMKLTVTDKGEGSNK